MTLPVCLVTDSANVRIILLPVDTAVALSAGLTLDNVGTVVSTMKVLLLPKEPEAPGEGRVKVASFSAASFIVPLFKTSDEVDL